MVDCFCTRQPDGSTVFLPIETENAFERTTHPPLTLPPAFRIGASLPEARRRNVSAPFMCSPCAPYVLASSCAPESGECNVTDRPTTCGDPPGRWGVMSPPGGSPHSVMPHVGPRWGRPHGCDARGVNDLPPCAGYRIYHITACGEVFGFLIYAVRIL